MIKLFDYLTESIFDDEEQMSNVENLVYSDLLKGTYFSVGTDGKTIIYNPSDGYAHGVFDRRLSFGYKSISANIQKLNKAGLKFQPLTFIFADNGEIDKVKDIPIDTVVSLSLGLFDGKDFKIDLTKLKFDIINTITIKSGSQKSVNIKPYHKHVHRVELVPSRYGDGVFKVDEIEGWDCDELIVQDSDFDAEVAYGHGDGLCNGYSIEKIQTLINNNPKAKTIYLYNRDIESYWKINTKGSKRIFDKLVNRKPKDQRSEYLDAQEYVWGWEAQHQDLFPNR